MKRWDATLVIVGLVVAALGYQIVEKGSDRYIAAVALATLVLTAMTLNHLVPRSPRLVVTYANPLASDRPVVWNDHPTRAQLQVRVENHGHAPARAVEVEFDSLGMWVFNVSGNPPDPQELNVRENPPRFTGGERVLNPGDSPWRIASLHATYHPWHGGTVRWRANAEGMEERRGTIEITLLDGPPE
jgi:hypothetical protein